MRLLLLLMVWIFVYFVTFFVVDTFFFFHRFYSPAQPVRGFTLKDLLDEPWP